MKPIAGRLVTVLLALSSTAALRGQTYEVLANFGRPGPAFPKDLIQDGDGYFYGAALAGGQVNGNCADGCGAVFRMDGDGVVTSLHEFTGGDGGQSPIGPFRASSGDLYGMTLGGGTGSNGSAYRIDSSGIFTTIHSFWDGTDGRYPSGALIEPQPGDLWGTTLTGGNLALCGAPNGCGTIFRMHLNGDLETMHAFNGDDGSRPHGPLLLADDGNVYGTTNTGGVADQGTIFRITLNGNLTVLHELSGSFSYVNGGLIQASNGDLIGTIYTGDGGEDGSVYRMTLDGNFEILHAFASDGHEGRFPQAPVLKANDGFFYGTTTRGGANDRGTVFRLGEDGTLTTIHDFEATPQEVLPGALIQAADGRLYGTTIYGGGTGGDGVVFRITLPPPHYYCPAGLVRRDQMAAFLLKMSHGVGYVPPTCASQFPDVACPSLFADWVEELAAEGVTAGCGGGNYCPLAPVTRAQMAVFLLKTEHGAAYTPPDCAGIFPDVDCPSLFAPWIEQLAVEGITAGCAGGNFCPDSPVTRAQMAVFLLKIEHGSGIVPPACQHVFNDVDCPSQFADWIEALYGEGITAGCAGS
jgi:uncharacterized repeat protein (TIGR03803 family)